MVLWDDYYGNSCVHHDDVRACRQCSPSAAEDTTGSWVLLLVLGALFGAVLGGAI